jgi:RING finger protein 126
MPKEEIEQLPFVNISQENVDKNLQCTVCMEDYKLNEPVRKLPCTHVYHNDCIVPWLEMVSGRDCDTFYLSLIKLTPTSSKD